MPIIIIDRLPLPSFKTYVALSVGLFSLALYHGLAVTKDPAWKSNLLEANEDLNNTAPLLSNASRSDFFTESKFRELALFMLEDSLCFWGFINAAYCFLVILAKCIQLLFFGELRSIEVQHLKDKFYTFVFYKFIFIFGIINVQYIDEVMFWLIWFTIIGFLQLVSQLCKDRFDYLSQAPVFLKWNHSYLISLLGMVSSISCSLFISCIIAGAAGTGYSAFTFMIAECILLLLKLAHTIVRYCFYLHDIWSGLHSTSITTASNAVPSESMWKKRGPVAYYAEFCLDLAALVVELVHYGHMLVWVWTNMFMSVASFMICMQLKVVYQEISAKLEKHGKYRRVLEFMEKNYPKATAKDLAENSDKCPICWEAMESARKLPCAHLFHSVCLQSWLEQDTSCPTCRLTLNIHNMENTTNDNAEFEPNGPRARAPNHFFHFDGSRYISWLPSFSVEVTHGQFIRTGELIRDTSQLDSMARQVQQMFPHFPVSVLTEDLHTTRSVELTIENILDGRLILPPQLIVLDDESPSNEAAAEIAFQEAVRNANRIQREEEESPEEQVVEEEEEEEEEELTDANIEKRFSRGSHDRQKILIIRRDKLIREAKKKFLEKLATQDVEEKLATQDIEEKLATQDIEEKLATQDVEEKLATQDVEEKLATQDVEEKLATQDVEEQLATQDIENKLDTETDAGEPSPSDLKESNAVEPAVVVTSQHSSNEA